MKVDQVKEARKFVRMGIDLQISNHILVVKVDQVKEVDLCRGKVTS